MTRNGNQGHMMSSVSSVSSVRSIRFYYVPYVPYIPYVAKGFLRRMDVYLRRAIPSSAETLPALARGSRLA